MYTRGLPVSPQKDHMDTDGSVPWTGRSSPFIASFNGLLIQCTRTNIFRALSMISLKTSNSLILMYTCQNDKTYMSLNAIYNQSV